ncbi:MAG TPA: hypothetical protein VK165_07280, partial [Azonexus sp.]|nr:hypothetical protein [Azonexus sp.]
GDRHFVRFAQDRNHLRFGKSALSHDSLSARKPSSQVSAGPKIPGQVTIPESQSHSHAFSTREKSPTPSHSYVVLLGRYCSFRLGIRLCSHQLHLTFRSRRSVRLLGQPASRLPLTYNALNDSFPKLATSAMGRIRL